MTRRNIEIPEPHVKELDKIAEIRDVSMPQVVRDLIKDYLEARSMAPVERHSGRKIAR